MKTMIIKNKKMTSKTISIVLFASLLTFLMVSVVGINTSYSVGIDNTQTMEQKLVNAQADLSRQLQTIDKSQLPINAIFTLPKESILVVGIDYDAPLQLSVYKERIQKILPDIPILVDYGKFEENACTARSGQRCDPIIGGIEDSTFQVGTSTLTLGATNTASKKGFVMSGHAANPAQLNTQIGQNDDTRLVGNEITNPSGIRSCDCAFVEFKKFANGTYAYNSDQTKIFKGSNTAYTITAKVPSSQTPANTAVKLIGKTSGEVSGTVVTINAQVPSPTYGTLNGQTLVTFNGAAGDSGAPVISPGTTNVSFYGIYAGNYQIGTVKYGVYSPWQHIQSELSLNP